jgi:hypothetical protein
MFYSPTYIVSLKHLRTVISRSHLEKPGKQEAVEQQRPLRLAGVDASEGFYGLLCLRTPWFFTGTYLCGS